MSALDIGLVLSWKNGTIQEVIPEDGETRADAIGFVRAYLIEWRPDLFFYDHEVQEMDGSFYFRFWERDRPQDDHDYGASRTGMED